MMCVSSHYLNWSLVGKFVEETDNPDLTQALLQVRARLRSHTVTARRQTDRLAGRTYANAAARASDAASAVSDTNAASNDARNDRARRRASRRR